MALAFVWAFAALAMSGGSRTLQGRLGEQTRHTCSM